MQDPVVLFVSDMHFGQGPGAREREKETALIRCLEAHAEATQHLYLVGDVFDGYIEYRHLVPKGFVRFQALLARWTDRGIPVTYLFGNHDPWHRDYFSEEMGVELVPETLEATHHGRCLHLAHGDAQASTHRGFSWLRPLMRHPLAHRLYRSLPADLGIGLARRISRVLHDPSPDPAVIDTLRAHAHRTLRRGPADVVIMGHSHKPVLHQWADGAYANTGNWYENRTFVRLDDNEISLTRWNGTRALDIESADV
ncbi:MAG: UDP-2,3-diacylglucosamine diphosphatase [Salinibacter sp.]